MFCRNCGGEMPESAAACMRCGFYMGGQPVRAVHVERGGNGLPVGGFICGLVGLGLPVPVIDVIVGIVGAALCTISLIQNRPLKGLAIAGLVIAIVAVIGGLILLISEPEFYRELWES